MITQENRIEALAQFLGCGTDELNVSSYDDKRIECGSQEYLVCTDSEADDKARREIKESLWAFNADFILSECGLDLSGAKSLKTMQEKSCEGANDFTLSLVEKCCGLQRFVDAAISADGRGHFLASYDSEENEVTIEIQTQKTNRTQTEGEVESNLQNWTEGTDETFYIYRVN